MHIGRCNGDLAVNELGIKRGSRFRREIEGEGGRGGGGRMKFWPVLKARITSTRESSLSLGKGLRPGWRRCNERVMHLLRFLRDQVSRWFGLLRLLSGQRPPRLRHVHRAEFRRAKFLARLSTNFHRRRRSTTLPKNLSFINRTCVRYRRKLVSKACAKTSFLKRKRNSRISNGVFENTWTILIVS